MADSTTPPRLYLVDGTSQIYRAYFALPPMTSPEGLPTHAVYGFTTMLRKLLKDEGATHLAVAFDPPGGVFRDAMFAAYKAHRPPTPPDLVAQMPYAKSVCRALGVPTLEVAGFEADDVIATWTRRGREAGYEVVIVASDKDVFQLVGDGVTVLNPSKDLRLDTDAVTATFGVPPTRVLDAQGLMGDAVDNIPGVPGVGEKTAIAVIAAYGDLEAALERAARFVVAFEAKDALLAALDAGNAPAELVCGLSRAIEALLEVERDAELRPRLEALLPVLAEAAPKTLKRDLRALDRGVSRKAWIAIHTHREDARLSRRLATLDRDVPVEGHVGDFRLAGANRPRVAEIYRELGFRSLLVDLERETGLVATPVTGVAASAAPEIEPIVTRDALVRLAAAVSQADRLGVAVLADPGDPLRVPAIGLGLADAAGLRAYVPLGHAYLGAPVQLSPAIVAEVLGPALAATRRVGHDVKRLSHLLRRSGIPTGDWSFDTRVAAFLLDSDRGDYPLDALAAEHLGLRVEPFDALVGVGAKRRPVAELEVGAAATRLAEDAHRACVLAEALERRLTAAGLDRVYREIDGPLLPLLARMEAWGIRVDCDVLSAMSAEMGAALERLRGELFALAGVEFNPDSPKQLREVLFERLGLATRRKTEKGRLASTDAQALEELAAEHEIARKLLDYRELSKLKGTYVDALPRLVHPETGRVHTSFDPTGAATGRLSSSDPNLQNIPVRSEVGRRIRGAFVADPGFVFLSSDYSQIELRVLAHLSGDEGLRSAFAAGEDIHRFTAARVFGVLPDLVTGEMRRRAKAVNFGILYGMSETRLAREQGMGRADARQFIQAYFARFARVRGYIDRVREEALAAGEVRTLFGRVRRFPQLRGRLHRVEQEQALRAAVNATIQGTAADLMKAAMLAVERDLAAAGLSARMLLQVHDELLLEVPLREAAATQDVVRSAMEQVLPLDVPLDVPLAVDQKVGRDWLGV